MTQDILSDFDELTLLQLAESYMASGQHTRLMECCNRLIRRTPTRACYRDMRATAHSETFAFDKAVEDMQRAVELEPDNATYHAKLGGYLVSREAVRYGCLTDAPDNRTLERITRAYRLSLEKDPAQGAAWINLLEILVMTEQWDDAIACYGISTAYVTDPEFQLIRAFLGCLALVLAGGKLLDEDLEALENDGTRRKPYTYRFDEIDTFVRSLDIRNYEPQLVAEVNQLRNRFVGHFTHEPMRYCRST